MSAVSPCGALYFQSIWYRLRLAPASLRKSPFPDQLDPIPPPLPPSLSRCFKSLSLLSFPASSCCIWGCWTVPRLGPPHSPPLIVGPLHTAAGSGQFLSYIRRWSGEAATASTDNNTALHEDTEMWLTQQWSEVGQKESWRVGAPSDTDWSELTHRLV